jgi:hypothetical protein
MPLQETSEGFESSLALLYWNRILFMHRLLPLLTSPSTRSTYPPRIISILGAGFESASIRLHNLDLGHPQNFRF